MTVKRGIFIIGTFQCITATADAPVIALFRMLKAHRWLGGRGRVQKHVAYRVKIGSWVGKVLRELTPMID